VQKKFVPLGQTVNQDVYKGVLQRLRESIRRRFPELWATGKWFLLHDNTRPYTALSVKEFLSVHKITLLPHALHYPDLSHCDFSFIFTTETSTETQWLC
jgi:2-C-methyl-D-erythritol 4-phosphate cytidylyltransferase